MTSFILVLLTLDVRTGDFVKADVIGTPYATLEGCIREAIGHGPQRSTGEAANVLVCSPDERSYTRVPPVSGSSVTS
jgi:hypothetical protein